jgi:hypothetical protein
LLVKAKQLVKALGRIKEAKTALHVLAQGRSSAADLAELKRFPTGMALAVTASR